VKRRVVPFVLTASLSFGLTSCRSDRRNAEDLRGVFDRTAMAPDASATASASSAAEASPSGVASGASSGAPAQSARPAASSEATAPVARRQPVKGPCLAPSGEAARLDERRARRPTCRGAEVLELADEGGPPRYACVFRPNSIEQRAPLPLVLFFHAHDESPAKVSRETSLRDLADEYEFGASSEHRGFIVLAPQARRLERHVAFDARFVSDENADVRTTDRFVEVLEKRGWVDRRRVYTMGAGRGGEMAALYAMARPGRVSAFASVAGNASSLRWTCEVEPPPAVVVYRACDSVTACLDVEQWLLAREQARAPTLALRLGIGNQPEPACALDASKCRREKGEQNHRRWPKGKERALLDYLGRYSLALPEP
jgi:poly(3-hydroxybutyrate) depolymerase